MTEVGIIITADDKAKAVLNAVGAAGKASLDGIRKSAASAGKALEVFAIAATGINQAMELGKKAVEIFRAAILDSMTAMVEFRGETDPISQEFAAMNREASHLRATLANTLTPIFLGLRDAVNSTGNQFVELLQKNKQLIATNITVFLADTARVLIKGVAFGFVQVSRVVSGLIELFHLLKAGVEASFSFMLEGIALLIDAHAAFLGSIPGIGGKIKEGLDIASGAVRGLAAEFAKSAGDSVSAIEDQIAAQDELEKKILKYKDIAVDFVGTAEVAVLKRIKKGWSDVTLEVQKTAEAQKKIAQSVGGLDGLTFEIDALSKKQLELFESTKIVSESMMSMGDTFGQMIKDIHEGQITMNQALQQMGASFLVNMLDIAEQMIFMWAAVSAAEMLAKGAVFGPLGIAIGVAAAATIFGLVKAYASQLPQAAMGGVIGSGAPGADTQAILTQRGEGILKPGQTEIVQRLADNAERGNGGGGSTVIHVEFSSIVPATSADTARAAREISKMLKRTMARGY